MTTTGERPMNFMEEVNSETQAMLNQLTTKTIMSKTTSQNVAILNFLESGGSLSTLEALEKFQCFRLSARIKDLRESGHDIQTKMVRTKSGKKVAEYFLPKIPKQGELF